MQSVGYIPQASARALSSRRTRTLGAIIPTIDNTMFARGIAALQKYLSSVGYMLLLTTSGYDLDVELEQARNLISRGVDGLVLRGDCHHDGLRKMLADNAIPFINVGVYRPDRPYPCVGADNEAAAYRAALHVVELGHRRIGIVSALQRNNDRASARVDGFRRALSENGIALPPQWHVEVPYTLDDAREAAQISSQPAGTAEPLVCGNDVIAYGVLLEAERSGYAMPRDLGKWKPFNGSDDQGNIVDRRPCLLGRLRLGLSRLCAGRHLQGEMRANRRNLRTATVVYVLISLLKRSSILRPIHCVSTGFQTASSLLR